MNKDYEITQMYMPLYAACAASALGFLFFMFGFGAPYWVQTFDETHSSFLHMGIWSVCFDDFVHPRDYAYNHYSGCYWIFNRFFFQTSLWFWINPHILIAIQVMVTAAFLVNIAVIIVLIMYFLLLGQPASESTMAFYGQIVTAILLTLSTILFGWLSQKRWWMQRPDHMYLAWGYGFIVLAALCSYVAAGFLFCVSYTDRASQRVVEFIEATGDGGQSTILGGGYPPSMMTGMHSQYGGRSVIGGTGSNIGGVTIKVPTKGGGSEIVTLNAPVAAHRGYGNTSVISGPGTHQPGMYAASSLAGGVNKPGSLIGSEDYGAGDHSNYYPGNPSRDQVPPAYGYNRNYQQSPQSEEDMLSDGGYDQQNRRLYNR